MRGRTRRSAAAAGLCAAILTGGAASPAVAFATPTHAAVIAGRSSELDAVQLEIGWRLAGLGSGPLPSWLSWTGADALHVDGTAAAWRSSDGVASRKELYGVGVRPTLRWSLGSADRLFAEFGLGPRLWSGTLVGRTSRFGTSFEFGTIVGIGWRFEGADAFLRVEHTSNAGIRDPNPGLDMIQFGLAWRLDDR